MKWILIISLFPMFTFAAPRDISVQVDGKTYTCLPSGTPTPNPCEQEAKKLKAQFENCTQGYAPAACVDRVFSKVNKACPEVQQLCYDSCTQGYAQAFCYDKCY